MRKGLTLLDASVVSGSSVWHDRHNAIEDASETSELRCARGQLRPLNLEEDDIMGDGNDEERTDVVNQEWSGDYRHQGRARQQETKTGGDFQPGELKVLLSRESDLAVEHSDQEWADIESRFSKTYLQVAFSLDAPRVPVSGQDNWGLEEFAPRIVEKCESIGITFESPGLALERGKVHKLTGQPRRNNKTLWKTMRRGYIMVMDVAVWLQPMFTGSRNTNVDLIELEYSNANPITAPDLMQILYRWGAKDALVVSHGASSRRKQKWPSIACVTKPVNDAETNDAVYAFRLCFDSPATTNAVYETYLRQDKGLAQDIPHSCSIVLRPVMNVVWDAGKKCMLRRNSDEALATIYKSLYIYGFRAELRAEVVQDRLAELGYPGCNIAINPGQTTGMVKLQSKTDADRLNAEYGVRTGAKLSFGNIKLFVDTPGPEGERSCFKCGRAGHFARNCKSLYTSTTSQPDGRQDRHSNYARQQRATSSQSMMESMAPVLKAMIAAEVKEQSQSIRNTVRTELDRHTRIVDDRLHTNENAISALETAQAKTASSIDEMSAILKLIAARIGVSDFGTGGLDRGTDPRQ
ncbi:hypothetical protein PR002_g20916 [Phytophthora rubi]|nr:hypothetical protein PR002_g20916 [Phytophthora rubi]